MLKNSNQKEREFLSELQAFKTWVKEELGLIVQSGYMAGDTYSPLLVVLPNDINTQRVEDYFLSRTGKNVHELGYLDQCAILFDTDVTLCSGCGKFMSDLTMESRYLNGFETEEGTFCVECISDQPTIRRAYFATFINTAPHQEELLPEKAYKKEGFQLFYYDRQQKFSIKEYRIFDLYLAARNEGYAEVIVRYEGGALMFNEYVSLRVR